MSDVDKLIRTQDEIMADTEVHEFLGRGMSGRTYRVTYKGVEACMKKAWDVSDEFKNDFMTEAKALCIVDGAGGAPKLLAASEDGLVLIMECCTGYTLCKFAALVGSSEDRAKLAQEIMLALEAVHKTGHAHGDIHGDNIIVCGGPGQYHVRLIDFCRCRELEEDDVKLELREIKMLMVALKIIFYITERYFSLD